MSSASKRSVSAAQFVPQHENRHDGQWLAFRPELWGMTCYMKKGTLEYVFPPRIVDVTEDGQADKNGVKPGDVLLAFRIDSRYESLPQNPVHDIFNRDGKIDAFTQDIFNNPPALRFFVYMPNRCGLRDCLGRVIEMHDKTDHCLVCPKCATVHRSSMQGTMAENLSEVQQEQQRLRRMPGPLKCSSDASDSRTETMPGQSRSKISELLRKAQRTEDKLTCPAMGRETHVQHEMDKTDKLMNQIVSAMQLTPVVKVLALEVFKDYVDTKRKTLADGGQVIWFQKVVVACIFIAANKNKTPRTIWHLISPLTNEDKIEASAVLHVLPEMGAQYEEFKCMIPIYLVESMCVLHKYLKKHEITAKMVLNKFEFKGKKTVELMVAVAFAYASASTPKIYDVEVLRIMKEWLYVSSDQILKQIGGKDFSMPATGDGGAAK